jgi:hypothetical protein
VLIRIGRGSIALALHKASGKSSQRRHLALKLTTPTAHHQVESQYKTLPPTQWDILILRDQFGSSLAADHYVFH